MPDCCYYSKTGISKSILFVNLPCCIDELELLVYSILFVPDWSSSIIYYQDCSCSSENSRIHLEPLSIHPIIILSLRNSISSTYLILKCWISSGNLTLPRRVQLHCWNVLLAIIHNLPNAYISRAFGIILFGVAHGSELLLQSLRWNIWNVGCLIKMLPWFAWSNSFLLATFHRIHSGFNLS